MTDLQELVAATCGAIEVDEVRGVGNRQDLRARRVDEVRTQPVAIFGSGPEVA